MYLLKEHLRTFTSSSDRRTTFARLLAILKETGLEVVYQSESSGKVVALCLSRVVNMIVWRCWSEKLYLELTNAEGGATIVSAYSVPSLFRFRIKKDEQVCNLDDVLNHLSALSR